MWPDSPGPASSRHTSMNANDKSALSERDIRTKFVTPALVAAGWDLQSQLREEVTYRERPETERTRSEEHLHNKSGFTEPVRLAQVGVAPVNGVDPGLPAVALA